MTEEQEQILQAVLRNQEVIMNALVELLNTGPEEMPRGLRRSRMIADLGTFVGFTHYFLAALERNGTSEDRGPS
jgi:hypothetical protein